MNIETDEKIILEFKKTGNKRLLNPLFKKYTDVMFGVAFYYVSNRERAMDIVMDSYEVMIKSIHQKNITHFKAWALGICRNLSLKRLRDDKIFLELTEFTESFMEKDESTVYSDEQIDQLHTYVKDLQENQRICIEDFYLNGMSYAEIAEKNEMSLNEIKSAIQNGKRNLGLMFERDKL